MKKVLAVLLASLLLLFCFAGCETDPTVDITELEDKNNSINATVNELNGKIATLEEKAKSLETKLAEVNAQIEELDKTNDTTDLEGTKATLQAEIDALKTDLTAELNSISETFTKLNEELDKKVDMVAESNHEAYEYVSEKSGLADDKISDTIEQAKTSFNEKITALEGRISNIESTLETLSQSVSALSEKVNKNESDIANLQGKVDGNETDISDLQEKVDALESEKSELESKLNDSNEDIAALLERIAALEAEKNAMQVHLSCLLSGTHSLTVSDNGDGTHTGVCDTCGYEVVSNHSVGYTDNGDGTHTEICDACGYEITTNHSVGYTNNEDGTHTKTCDACDYEITSEHSYTFTSNEDRHTNIASCACGENHYLDPYCACYSCEEFFHNVDENCYCSNCWDYIHNVNPTTGICERCNEFTSEASVTIGGTKTYYSMVNYALLAAVENPGSLVVLEKDATVRFYNHDFDNGNFTLDLNGKVFTANSNYALNEENTNITIKDSVGGGSFANGKSVTSSGTITFESGSAYKVFPSSGGALIVKGGRIDYVYVNTKSATLTLAGGSFGSVKTFAEYYSLADLLEEGYCYYDAGGNEIDIDSISADGNWYEIKNVTVAPKK